MIQVEQLAKTFGAVQALQSVSFVALDGRITGLLGANGAGKSTTLRIISTVTKASNGRALVDGHDCASETLNVRRALGVLPHVSGLYPHLTARENIRYFGRLHGLADKLIAERIDRWVETLALQDIIERRTQGFSHGQRLKIALARALIHAPRNLILDEPTSGLDIAGTRALRELIRTLRAQGHCILFSSHVMQEVAALCDDIVIIAKGRGMVSGSPQEILANTGANDLEEAFMRATGVSAEDAAGGTESAP